MSVKRLALSIKNEAAPLNARHSTLNTRRPRPGSLRVQLAFWQGGLLALTLLILTVFTYVLLRHFLYSKADSNLEAYAENTAKQIAATLYQYQTTNGAVLDTNGAIQDASDKAKTTVRDFIRPERAWGRYVQVVDRNGNVVSKSDALLNKGFGRMDEALNAGLRGEVSAPVVKNDLGEYPVRILTVPVQMGAKIPYLVQAGVSVEGVEAALQRASTVLLVLTPSVFVIALLGGWLLVGRALQPVDEMTRTALSIESKHLNVRLVPPRTDNEISRLATALNTMIARLDNSFRQIERFSADASHELKTPLTTIRGEAEVALMSPDTPPQTRQTLQSIVEETERLSSIVNNLLLLARADADQVRLKHEPVALHEVVLASYESLERLARRKTIRIDIDEMDEVTVEGDALWLQQLVMNLLQNAIQYTPEGGCVTLSLAQGNEGGMKGNGKGIEGSRNEATPNTEYQILNTDTVSRLLSPVSCLLSISDTGPGIAQEHLPHLFDRFYRADAGRSREQGGSGLGLNIARWIADSHGGQITVQSEIGVGTTFSVRLPAISPTEHNQTNQEP